MVTRRRQRGQLVLIAAILVATAVLGAVVLLNSVHSSPDVKSQTDAQSLSSAERTVDGIQQDLQQLNESENFQNMSVSQLKNVTRAYSEEFGNLASRDGVAVPSVAFVGKDGDEIIFEISYIDPSVTYNGEFTLSGGDG